MIFGGTLRTLKEATRKQLKVLSLVRQFIDEHSLSPTLKELAERYGCKVPAMVSHLVALEKKGYIRRLKNKARAITLVPESERLNDDER